MSVVYLMEQGAVVSKEGQRLLVKKKGQLLHTIHSFKLDQLVLFGSISLTPSVVAHLLQNGVDTAFMTIHGRYLGRLQPPEGKNILLRQAQYRRFADESFVLETARSIVRGKLANQRTVLMRLNRNREELKLEEMVFGLKKIMDKTSECSGVEGLRGYEGSGTATYFKGFSQGFLADGIQFTARVRRPPTNPVNALLSLGYTFLFNVVLAAVQMVGLEPYLGSLHTVDYGRPSLPLDLMEEWRPIIIDSLVLSVFNLETITEKDFTTERRALDDEVLPEGESCDKNGASGAGIPVYLTDSGFRKFLTQFERKMAQTVSFHLTGQELSYRDCIREQVRHFVRYVKGEDKAYIPITIK
ncbi:MAG: CRISPR-associated endonuclease Cas1 [Thermodesulfobacteriota bacterium]|nr:CRISPR-associated endonuclease Cas1 [Thermodesulfobacteriota bacterium]